MPLCFYMIMRTSGFCAFLSVFSSGWANPDRDQRPRKGPGKTKESHSGIWYLHVDMYTSFAFHLTTLL